MSFEWPFKFGLNIKYSKLNEIQIDQVCDQIFNSNIVSGPSTYLITIQLLDMSTVIDWLKA